MNRAFLLLGGNLGNRFLALFGGLTSLAEAGKIVCSSSFYITAPWGNKAQPDFLNCALEYLTPLDPRGLLDFLKETEGRAGARRGEKWGPRHLDMDILFYNDLVLQSNQLSMPHPGMADRRFALEPLAEIAAAHVHPVSGKTVSQMLASCKDTLKVQRL